MLVMWYCRKGLLDVKVVSASLVEQTNKMGLEINGKRQNLR